MARAPRRRPTSCSASDPTSTGSDARGPHAARVTPAIRLVSALSLVAFVETACSSGAGSGQDHEGSRATSVPTAAVTADATGLVLTFTATDRPTAESRFGGESRDAFVMSHCWGKPSEEEPVTTVYCVDTVAPSAEHLSPPLEVPRGTELLVDGNASSVQCSLAPMSSPLDPEVDLELTGGAAPLDQEPGTYALGCFASWPQGDVPFYFGIEIGP